MPNQKKFLDAAGVTHLVSLLDDYPNNEILGAVIDAIQGELDNIILIQTTEPSVEDNKIWINNSSSTSVTVPTVSEMNAALAEKADKVTSATNGNFAALDSNGNLTDSGHKHSDYLTSHQNIPVTNVQINGTSILNNSIANIPIASNASLGAVKQAGTGYSVNINENGELLVVGADSATIKLASSNNSRPILPDKQHESVFYGLAKVAGDTTQSSSSNSAGTYTADAKFAIKNMLGVGSTTQITVSGATPAIVSDIGAIYVCEEVSTISFTPCPIGTCEVIFTSGTTATVLTIPSTVKFPTWFNSSSLETNTIYDISIVNGTLGAVMTWPIT